MACPQMNDLHGLYDALTLCSSLGWQIWQSSGINFPMGSNILLCNTITFSDKLTSMVDNPPVASFSVPSGRWGRYLGIGRVFSACLQLNPCVMNSCGSHSAEPSPLTAVHFRLKFDFTLQGVKSLLPFLISLSTYGVCMQSTISRPPMCHLKDWLTHFPDGVKHHLQSDP